VLDQLSGRCRETGDGLAKSVVTARRFALAHHLRGTYSALVMLKDIGRLLDREKPKYQGKVACTDLLAKFLVGVAIFQGIKPDTPG
jgi:hypothetical protein